MGLFSSKFGNNTKTDKNKDAKKVDENKKKKETVDETKKEKKKGNKNKKEKKIDENKNKKKKKVDENKNKKKKKVDENKKKNKRTKAGNRTKTIHKMEGLFSSKFFCTYIYNTTTTGGARTGCTTGCSCKSIEYHHTTKRC